MKKRWITLYVVMVFLFATAARITAHCEIPCGIYDDAMRLKMIAEHATTIEKAMNQIKELSAAEQKDHNQLVRWISNKEEHANAIQEIVSQYFMTQRIKFDDKEYPGKLALLHKMLVYAMKSKQGTDTINVDNLRKALQEFEALYLGPEKAKE